MKEPKKGREITVGLSVYGIIHLVCFFIALFISLRCNKGFDLGSFLAACCCSPLYVIYKLALPTCTVIVNNTVQTVNWIDELI